MCGRFALEATPDEVLAHFAIIDDLVAFPPRYNIAPTQPVLMVITGERREPGSNLPDRHALLVRWGFIPRWAKDPKAMPLLLNARSETAIDKPAFRTAMRHRRALIPATGFYEWHRAGKHSQPYFIRPRGGGIVAFAALMETYAEPGGSEIDTAAILTTSANADLAAIHDRMPVVIAREDFARWLDCRTQEPREIADLMRPAQPGLFEALPISTLVNTVSNTGPEIQTPIDLAEVTRREPKKHEEPPESAQIRLL